MKPSELFQKLEQFTPAQVVGAGKILRLELDWQKEGTPDANTGSLILEGTNKEEVKVDISRYWYTVNGPNQGDYYMVGLAGEAFILGEVEIMSTYTKLLPGDRI